MEIQTEKPIVWTEEKRVDAHDVDFMGLLRPSAALRYIQDAAGHAHHCLGLSLEMLRDEYRLAYILSKVSMRFFGTARAYEPIRATTWITPVKGYSFMRYGQVWSGERPVMSLSSVWAMTDITNLRERKLVRGDSIPLPFGTGEALELGFPARFAIPKELAMLPVCTHHVRYPDCDRNRHMNNTIYPDLFRGFAEAEENDRVSELEIAYHTEAPMGESLTLTRGRVGNTQYFRSFREDGKVNAECRMVLVQE